MIHSIFIGTDLETVARLLTLHRAGHEILDVTFGNGRFWATHTEQSIGRDIVGLDLRMGDELTGRRDLTRAQVKGTWESLPFQRHSFDVVVCDPPFTARGGLKWIHEQRYTSNQSYRALIVSLERAALEFARVLRPDGLVLIKLMDITEGRRRRFAHIDVTNAWDPSFRLDDILIKVAPQAAESSTWKHQSRTRASHSYFMLFRRRRSTTGRRPTRRRSPTRGEQNVRPRQPALMEA